MLAKDFIFSGFGATASGQTEVHNHLKINERWQAVELDGNPWRELFCTSLSTRRQIRDLRWRGGRWYEYYWWTVWVRSPEPLDVSSVAPHEAWRLALAGAAPSADIEQQIDGNYNGIAVWFRHFCIDVGAEAG